jgi:hypothetical protein
MNSLDLYFQSSVFVWTLLTVLSWSDGNKLDASDALIASTNQRIGVNIKSCNFWILCCDNIPLANIMAPHVLHLSIIRPVLVGFNVAIDLQKRQYTARSHESITRNLL